MQEKFFTREGIIYGGIQYPTQKKYQKETNKLYVHTIQKYGTDNSNNRKSKNILGIFKKRKFLFCLIA